jgi:hypothetical protein
VTGAPGPGRPLVVAVEGACFAGKTTLTRALGGAIGAGVIAEYADLGPLPAFPPAGVTAVRTALIRFLAVEAGRARAARALGRPVVLLDRCPLTLIAHEHAMAAMGVPADPGAAAWWFSQAARAGAILFPDAYIWLRIGERELAVRQARRGALPGYLAAPGVRAMTGGVYAAYFAAAGPGRVLELDGGLPAGRLAGRAGRFIAGLVESGAAPPPPWTVLADAMPGACAAGTLA